jgi:DNA mismatch repair protein MutS2
MDAPRFLDLDDVSRRALEFDAVVTAIAGCAVTPMGASAVRRVRPMADLSWIAAEHAAVDEVARHLREHGSCVSGGLSDPDGVLDRLAPEGLRLDARELRTLAMVLAASDDLAERLAKLAPVDYPYLHMLAGGLPRWGRLARDILEGTGPDGRVLDEASPEIARIRARIARVGERLRVMLRRLIQDPQAEAFLRDDFVTERNGRFVVPVRADAADPLRGIVHGSSSSGATLFVEPLDSVELNNDRVRLAECEQEECERVLRSWAERLHERRFEVDATLEGVARVDSLQARARYAEIMSARSPTLADEGGIELREARHPVLDRALRERGERCVAATFVLAIDQHTLLLSGPNTGGKTVALKTIGLAVLMAQSGFPITAAEARLPVFRQLRADIGDHQSIEASLSTFSAHVAAVAGFLREASPPALFLFDEIGTGTEPAEGASLAQAVLEKLLELRVVAVATTHQKARQAWACTTPGVISAAMEFDVESLRPTYRVLQGVAGVSAGLDIALRLRMPADLVERARELLGPETREAEGYLNRIRQQLVEVEGRLAELSARRSELEEEHRARREREDRETERRRRADEQALQRALDEVIELGRREVARIGDAAQRARAEKGRAKGEAKLRAEVHRHKATLAGAVEDALPPADLRVGAEVMVRSLGKRGEIVSVGPRSLKVRLGATTFAVDRDDVRAAKHEAPVRAPAREVRAVADAGDVRAEIVLVGRTVDEALSELDKCLDRAAMAGTSEVRVVHGHGTGRLRAAVRRFLATHPLVESHRPDSGDAATIATLE